jgi:glutamate-ammonia-ligase adenylyltransferase
MRLRPSGRAGPVATALASFDLYQRGEAWTWEHMALTRARVVSASPAFRRRIEQVFREVLCLRRDRVRVARDVATMRELIATERGEADHWNIKDAAGGLIDLEFMAQYLQLVHAADQPDILDTSTERVLEKAGRLSFLSVEDAETLRPAGRLYHNLIQVLRVCVPGPFNPRDAGRGLQSLLARAGDLPDFASLEAHLMETQMRVRAIFMRLLKSP